MDFRLPEIGEGVYEAELINWLVKPGDPVKRGQNIMEVLTDKATMEVPSPFAGTITALEAQPGQMMKVGDAVLGYTPLGQPDGTPVPENGNRKAEPKPEPATVLAAPTKVNRLVGSLTIPAMVKAAP